MDTLWKWLLKANPRGVLIGSLLGLIAVSGWWTWREMAPLAGEAPAAGRRRPEESVGVDLLAFIDQQLTNRFDAAADPFVLPLHERVFTIAVESTTNGTVVPGESRAYPYGSAATFSFHPVTNHHVSRVLVDGAARGSTNRFTFVNISQPHTLKVEFAVDRHSLVIRSPYGVAIPAGRAEYGHETSNLVCRVTGSPIEEDGTRYACLGWRGTGSVPAVGRGTSVSITITNASTLTWLWTTEFGLRAGSAGNGKTTPAEVWSRPNRRVTVRALPDPNYEFEKWVGDVESTVNPLTVFMDKPYRVTAQFILKKVVVTKTAPAVSTTTQTSPTVSTAPKVVTGPVPVVVPVTVPVPVATTALSTPGPEHVPVKVTLTFRGVMQRPDGSLLAWLEVEKDGVSSRAFVPTGRPLAGSAGLVVRGVDKRRLRVVQVDGSPVDVDLGAPVMFEDGRRSEAVAEPADEPEGEPNAE